MSDWEGCVTLDAAGERTATAAVSCGGEDGLGIVGTRWVAVEEGQWIETFEDTAGEEYTVYWIAGPAGSISVGLRSPGRQDEPAGAAEGTSRKELLPGLASVQARL